MVQEGLEAILNADQAAFDRVIEKATKTEVAKLITAMVTSSRDHCQALIAQANALGNSSKMVKGIVFMSLGLGAVIEAKAVAAALAVSIIAVTIIGMILILLAIVNMYGAALSNAWEKIFQEGSGSLR